MPVNSVTIDGTLVADPELRFTPNGKAVCDVRVAYNEKKGEEKVSYFFDVTFWGYAAESLCEKHHKGTPLRIYGKLTSDEWEDRETGKKRSKTKLTSFDVPAPLSFKSRGEPKAPKPPRDDSFDDDFDGADIPF